MIRIISDTGCDFTALQAEKMGVELVPLGITFEDGSFARDRMDLAPEEFYQKLMECKKLPKTSQPPFGSWVDLFEDIAQKGDSALVITLSGELSGTYQGASAALDTVGCSDIYILDSRSASLGQNLIVRRAVKLRDKGLSVPEIYTDLFNNLSRIHLAAIIDDLKYLHKGGRLPAAATVAGSMLGIKPIVTLCDGKVKPSGKARGLPGAYVVLFKLIEEYGHNQGMDNYVAAFSHKASAAEPLVAFLEKHVSAPETETPILCHVGPAIGTHVGPGCVGIAFWDKSVDPV